MAFWRLKHNPANGDVAIYSVPSRTSNDNAPLTDPLNNKARLQFHSGLIYPSTSAALTKAVSVTIPSQAGGSFSGTIVLFAHGKGEPCMVEGYIVDLNGLRVDLNGSVPVFSSDRGHATWVALCCNETNVILRYWGIGSGTRPAQTFSVVASAFDFLSTGPAPTGDPALPRVRYYPATRRFLMGRGRFDSFRRYVRRVASGGDKPLATGPTVSIIGSGSGSIIQNSIGWRWRYSCGGYVVQTTVAWNGTATNGGTYDAPFIWVKI
ncbi:hypothetical protein [Hyphomicrobium sp. ghe19]|uniref:hypothetical protein n=1 Tax=Hyphomicrobium sp. ghe19 TaxID=2682968 RepID=UPI0013670EB4|nr:hypothetical protein HYPP_03760 [Hyphomicrobium sp. ghe19]